jgi:hypothetical protein
MDNETIINNAYEELANAIVLRAVEDYRKAHEDIRKNKNIIFAKISIAEIERFFRSGWYKELTSVDGEVLLQKLKKEMEEAEVSENENLQKKERVV